MLGLELLIFLFLLCSKHGSNLGIYLGLASLHLLMVSFHLLRLGLLFAVAFLLHLSLHLLGLLGIDSSDSLLLVGSKLQLLVEHSNAMLNHLLRIHVAWTGSTALGLCAHASNSQQRHHDYKNSFLHCFLSLRNECVSNVISVHLVDGAKIGQKNDLTKLFFFRLCPMGLKH